ncbi:MAG TPA: hypothetical protein VLQ80_10025, partial [Candidatus Saccharimonadia bacterium]|nr:hypothetical protein [Candidatus Saccharimonadia bacterium]
DDRGNHLWPPSMTARSPGTPPSVSAEGLLPRLEADGVADVMIETEIETVKSIVYYKNYL